MGQPASKETDVQQDLIIEGRLNFLLMGKTGHGKSATGNSILNRSVFKTSSNMTSVTQEVSSGHVTFDNCILMVVDGPGLEDTDINKVCDTAAAEKNMDKALAMCSTGVNAFLLVIKFGVRFTAEEVSVLETLKGIFGEKYFDHVIVVMTHGDLFERKMEEDNCGVSFEKWCRQQTGEFSRLFKACSGRVVLINNVEKNEEKKQAQRQQIVHCANNIRTRHGRYTSTCFEIARNEKFKIELDALILREEIQEKIDLLSEEIEKLPKQPSNSDRKKMWRRIQALKHEIEACDTGHGTNDDLIELLEHINSSLHDTSELQRLEKNLKKTRMAETSWNLIRPICAFCNGVLRLIMDRVTEVAAVAKFSFMSRSTERRDTK